ncbi:MAG: DUF6778 family protein [Jhaorihella sp.]
MKIARTILSVGLGLGVSACAAVDVPTRNAPYEHLPTSAVAAPAGYQPAASAQEIPAGAAPRSDRTPALAAPGAPMPSGPIAAGAPVSVNSVTVRVPRSLKVSERNSYLPRGDIVWRGDPMGDRHAQVQKIFQDALGRGAAQLQGPVSVDLDVQVRRFHALTEKARYSTGGVHAITFDLALKDPASGALLMPIRTIRADLKGYGGQQAIQADARGETQKVRISNHLAEVIRQELTSPEGYKNASLGFIQMLNNL